MPATEQDFEPDRYWPRDSWNGVLALVVVAGTVPQVAVFLAVMFLL